MPVPVSPFKDESSQSASAGIPGAMTITQQETTRTPASSTPNPQNIDIVDPDVVAGYQDCLKETIRFLLEEEQLSTNHPVVMGLAAHLTRDHAHVELSKLSQELTSVVLACASPSTVTTSVQSNIQDDMSPVMHRTVTAGYEVTLLEDSDDNEPMHESESDAESVGECSDGEDIECDECSDGEDIECDDYSDSEEAQVTEAIMSDLELRQQLLRFVYQGCDLIAAPQPISELHQGLIVQL